MSSWFSEPREWVASACVGGLLGLMCACGGGGGSSNTSGSTTTTPSFSIQPAPQTITAGTPVSFSASASGSPAPTYQWERSLDGANWSAVSGATSATYTFSPQSTDDGAQFHVRATNTAGSATSNPARLTVQYGPAFSVQPIHQTVLAGAEVEFIAGATGNPAPTFTWERSNDGLIWLTIPTATQSTLSFTAQPADHGVRLRARASNGIGPAAFSSEVSLGVNFAPIVITGPSDQSVMAGTNVIFTGDAIANPPAVLSWERSTDGTIWDEIPGVLGGTCAVAAVLGDDGALFRLLATNGLGATASAPARLNAWAPDPPVIKHLGPIPDYFVAGARYEFTVQAEGRGPLHYRWFKEGKDAGIDSPTFVIPCAGLTDIAQYAVRVSNDFGVAIKSLIFSLAPPFAATAEAARLELVNSLKSNNNEKIISCFLDRDQQWVKESVLNMSQTDKLLLAEAIQQSEQIKVTGGTAQFSITSPNTGVINVVLIFNNNQWQFVAF